MNTKINTATVEPGDIMHVRGKVYSVGGGVTDVEFESGDVLPFFDSEIVAHFPAIRSWSEIEGRLNDLLPNPDTYERKDVVSEIIALLNEIDPKGDA
jgi:hypothetical protein